MNSNLLKKFAQEARIKLLEQVGAKLTFVLTTDSVELREKTEQIKQLREQLNKTSKEQLIEKVAYTWFNRLMALRFMDANDYQPLGIRIITPKDGYTTPELLDEAKRGNLPDDLKLKRQRVFDLLDNRIPSTNPQNEAFKKLLIATCNYLHTSFPFLFEKINDYTELLLPDDLTSDFSIVTDIRKGMPVEDCKNVEIIGWLYQFYISEKKDEVFASKAKVKKEDIPAATQLFTPRWIVEYMVQNTVGKLWLQNRPKSRLREHMPYFIESASLTTDDYLKISSPEEIKLADPASGSGHILVYAFDLFIKIYEEEGYNTNDIPKLIIEKNLYGFEIDERAAQLSGLVLMMKAREYERRALIKDLQPNILCFQDLSLTSNEIRETLDSLQIQVSDELMHDLLQMQQATNFGSLILPHANKSEIIQLLKKLNQLAPSVDVFQRRLSDILLSTLSQLLRITETFHCVVANPPYMGSGKMNNELTSWVKENYSDSKADLSACFVTSALYKTFKYGLIGFVTLDSWMFLSSFELFRKKLISNSSIKIMIHVGWNCFPQGHVYNRGTSFIISNSISKQELGKFINLSNVPATVDKKILFEKRLYDKTNIHIKSFNDFAVIPGSPIAYWLTERTVNIFNQGKNLGSICPVRKGNSTSNNNRFLRLWYETQKKTNAYDYLSTVEANKDGKRWIPYNKGGGFRRWYGYQHYLIDWKNNAEEIRSIPTSVVTNEKFYMKRGLTWGTVTSYKISIREFNEGFIFDNGGCCIFTDNEENRIYLLGLLNSITFESILAGINLTLNFQSGEVSKFPVLMDSTNSEILTMISECVRLSKQDWDKNEESWNFSTNELIRLRGSDNIEIEEVSDLYSQFWKNRFLQMHSNEEILNQYFIKTYDLQDELTPKVHIEDITILQDEIKKETLQNLNKKLIRNQKSFLVQNYHEIFLPFNLNEVMAQFISYSVGCMFGRYSLDKEGLILANQGETLQDYLQKISKSEHECTFLPDEDNIIPILDNEWFEDDIVGLFKEFLKSTFGENNFNKNLAFIEEQIGKDLRKYFMRDFYPEHIKRFKKRPFYWMLSSPNGSFNALIYMHRYTPDTVSNILNKYLKEFLGKLNTRKEYLSHIQVTGSPAEKNKAIKENDNIDRMLIELQEYERDVLYPLATERIAIDLDDGVLVNYNKFGKAVKEVSGLSDKKTKDKVRKFDWIDTTQIR